MDNLRGQFNIAEGIIKECFKRVEGGDYELADTSSGEVNVFRKAAKNKRVMVDTGNYVKFFREGLSVIQTLGFGGMSVFIYIAINLKPHRDDIYLPCELICKECNISRRTYYRAIGELLKKKVISRRQGSTVEFFVNINYVFNGSRLKLKTP
jgi:hypothetical protein